MPLIIDDLTEDAARALKQKAQAAGVPVESYARQILQRELQLEVADAPPAADPPQTAAEIILRHMRDVPNEAMDQMPKDGASHHDHYIYGWPKKEA
jgi:plasmid stability protein